MFVRLDSTDFVESFDCGDADLNDFITNQADSFAKALLSVSYACVDSTCGKTLAFCSLANDKVSISDFNDKTEYNRFRKHQGFPQGKRLKSYPAVKLCRLGVDVSARGFHIGSWMLDYIKSMFVVSNKTGCRFLTVDAYLAAIPFYEKNGFVFLNETDKNNPYTRLMYFDLMDIVG
ncbi:MAG: GNAT family N-acetyltransferase [Fibrobacter sp.]|nr:GNAT family N-acetyltransferase [Fibrobacter sp.]